MDETMMKRLRGLRRDGVDSATTMRQAADALEAKDREIAAALGLQQGEVAALRHKLRHTALVVKQLEAYERDFVATCSLHAHVGLEAEVAALRERLAEAERDAERYQWLRANNKVGGRCCIELECDPPELCTCETGHNPHELDAAIDAARADKEGRHPSTQMTLDRVAAETDAAMRAKFAEADGAGESTRTCKSCGFVAKSDGWLNCPRCTAAATPPAEVK